MWFNALRVYRLTKPFEYSPEQLAELLAQKPFEPCGKQELFRTGWFPPLGHNGKSLVHAANGYIMLCAKKQERVLPAAVINEALEEKVRKIQEDESRSVGRKEKQTLKEEIQFDLLPRALTRSSVQYAYIAPNEKWLVINSGSTKKAEDFLSLIRDTIGSLPVIPLATKQQPMQIMTSWLKNEAIPKDFTLGDECELTSLKEEGRSIRCKKHDLSADEVLRHLDTGMQVKKLGVIWQDSLECIIEDDLGVKRLKFSEEILEKAAERHPETAAEEFDLDFNIMTLELKGFIAALTKGFGGLNLKKSAFEHAED